MRTKTLLTTAALSVAGLLSASAQVYSVNAVGYVNLTLVPGFNMIANPLNAPTNKLSAILAASNIPDGSTVYLWDKANQRYNPVQPLFYNPPGQWDTDATIDPGTGFFFFNAGLQAITNTFVGEVLQGNLTNAVVGGYQIMASKVPQAGKVTTDLGLSGYDGNTIYTWQAANQRYNPIQAQFVQTGATPDIGAWDPAEPTVAVGEAFFYFASANTKAWTRSFNVNN